MESGIDSAFKRVEFEGKQEFKERNKDRKSQRSELPEKKKILNQFIFWEERVEEMELESENCASSCNGNYETLTINRNGEDFERNQR